MTAGLAEIAAGSIAMALGGYLAARSDAEHYGSERACEEREVVKKPDDEAREIADVFESYGLTPAQSAPIVEALRCNPKAWVDFMMRFELGLEQPDPKRAFTSALTIAASYIGGGFIPLAPYLFYSSASRALPIPVVFTLLALAIFGYVKGHFTGTASFKSALQTVLIGGLAAAAAFGIAHLIS